MKIREANIGDLQDLAGAQKKMALETEDLTLDHAILENGIANLLNDPTKGKYYIAEIDNQFAGCLMTTFEWSDWRNGTILWIQSVYVMTSFRRMGVYHAMYDHIRTMVNNEFALKGIRLYAEVNNANAHRAYIKSGMDGDHYKIFEWIKK